MCPYVRQSVTRIYSANTDPNTGYVISDITNETYTYTVCQRELCGAWYDNKCNYKGV